MLARLLLLALLFPPTAAAQTTYAWNGANPGDWDNAKNWSPEGVPGPGDVAVIANGQPVLDADASIAGFTLSGGTLSGDGNLTVTGTATWSGGMLNGSGYAATAAVTIAPAATLFIVGSGTKTWRGRDLYSGGTIVWEGTGDIALSQAVVFQNQLGATFDIRNDASISQSTNTLVFTNDGLILKSGGVGTSNIDNYFGQFINNGTVRVEAGTLRLGGSLTPAAGDGAFQIASGAVLQFGRTAYTFGSGSAVTGQGRLLVTGGTAQFGSVQLDGPTDVAGGSLIVTDTAELADVTLSGGTLSAVGTMNINGLVTWTGGAMRGGGQINFLGGVLADGPAAKSMGGATTYNNVGTFTWTGSGNLSIIVGAGTGTFNNVAGALFDIQSDAGWGPSTNAFTIVNSGLMRKSAGTGTTTLQTQFAPFHNDGEIDVQEGTLTVAVNQQAANTSTDTGTWVVREGATLRFAGHHRTFTEAASLGGAGTVDFASGTFANRATVRPGLGVGTLSVSSGYPAPQPEGVLELELGGLTPGTEHDVLAVAASVNLNGTLRLLLADGYVPAVGDSYAVLTGNAVTGSFTAVEPPDGVEVDVAYSTSAVTVTVTNVTVASEPTFELPAVTALHPPAPNPVRGRVALGYDVAVAGPVRVTVYDLLGRVVSEVVDGDKPPGRHAAVLEAAALPAGTYVVRMHTADVRGLSRTLTVIR